MNKIKFTTKLGSLTYDRPPVPKEINLRPKWNIKLINKILKGK